MLKNIEQWIDQNNSNFQSERISCKCFADAFDGFYPVSFLEDVHFVVVDNIPKPDFPGLREVGLGDFLDMKVDGITYKNTYYILPYVAKDIRLHFHELVHVAQWKHLGAVNFIQRYIEEIQNYGYENSPLEKMAYGLDAYFTNKGVKINVPDYVAEKI
ncbi:hypothetical protein L1D32_11700 [Shewanella insulae]|uniref:hypothetical protein n=1 Tax=Shewanella insulae TaxID=2681496 RepID=UPI001EFCC2CA|nr:hypothetical protein [Shewanella insulae]